VQDLESWDKIRNHLTILAKRLNKGRSLIHEGIEKVAKAPQHDDLPKLLQDIEKEHSRLLARKVLIERRKEEHERQMREMVCSRFAAANCFWLFECVLIVGLGCVCVWGWINNFVCFSHCMVWHCEGTRRRVQEIEATKNK